MNRNQVMQLIKRNHQKTISYSPFSTISKQRSSSVRMTEGKFSITLQITRKPLGLSKITYTTTTQRKHSKPILQHNFNEDITEIKQLSLSYLIIAVPHTDNITGNNF